MTSAAAQERGLAARLLGVLYLSGAILAGLTAVLSREVDPVALGGIAAFCLVAALAMFRLPPAPLLLHLGLVVGLVFAAASFSATGGSESAGRWVLPLVVAFCAAFLSRREAFAYVALVCVVHGLPALYDDHLSRYFVPELLVAIPVYGLIAGGGLRTKAARVALREQAERLAAEHEALGRVATEAVRARSADELYAVAAAETQRRLGATASCILRFEDDGTASMLGTAGDAPEAGMKIGVRMPIPPGTALDVLRREGRSVSSHERGPDVIAQRLNWASTVVAPVRVGDRIWGAIASAHTEPDGLPADAAERLDAFGEVLGLAVSNAEDRARLTAQAATDPLTGLGNHRAFHAALRSEVARAQRHGRPLVLVLVDIDFFKQLNDAAGHEAGDHALGEVADHLREVAREEDVLGRVGGDELAWLMPETRAIPALAAVDRLRGLLADRPPAAGHMTISAGIAELVHAPDANVLFRHADAALYWSKANGRDRGWIYDPEVVRGLSDEERARNLERSQALSGLRALARAIDAKDPNTREHSERVADLVARLAAVRDWPPSRIALLREAALVHDVGKIGVPDAILLKPGRLTPDEYEQVKAHAALGAQIVEDVLRPEQVDWIREHHERPDGLGYPRGLHGEAVEEGAALLAVADAYDVMVRSRHYSLPRSPAEALAECRSLAGEQFTPEAVDALEQVVVLSDQAAAARSG